MQQPPYVTARARLPLVALDGLDAEWMTTLLQAIGIEARVKSVIPQPIGTGQMADSFRIQLLYEGASNGAPVSVVCKLPATNPTSRATGAAFGAYLREVRFYQHLAATAGIRTPRCHCAEVDPQSHNFLLLLEDLAPAKQGDQLASVTREQAELALDEAARLHASHWNDPHVDDMAWVEGTRAAPKIWNADLIRKLWRKFREIYTAELSADCIRVGEALTDGFDAYRDPGREHRCLVHNDYRSDNMMFGTAEGGYPLAVLDWQSLRFGSCMTDVSYFIASGFSVEQRRRHERELLSRYHDSLLSLGVKDYPFERAWTDYALCSFELFLISFVAAAAVKRTERGDRMFMSMISKSVAQAMDHDAIALLQSHRRV